MCRLSCLIPEQKKFYCTRIPKSYSKQLSPLWVPAIDDGTKMPPPNKLRRDCWAEKWSPSAAFPTWRYLPRHAALALLPNCAMRPNEWPVWNGATMLCSSKSKPTIMPHGICTNGNSAIDPCARKLAPGHFEWTQEMAGLWKFKSTRLSSPKISRYYIATVYMCYCFI